MNGLLKGCLLFSLTAFAATTACADEPNLHQSFNEKYAAMKSAMAARDGRAMAALLAPDFVSTDVSGHTGTGAQMIDEVKQLPLDPNKMSQTTINSIDVSGDTALVNQTYDMHTQKAGAGATLQNVELISVSNDTWINSNGKWLLQSTTTEKVDYFINGRSVLHKTRHG